MTASAAPAPPAAAPNGELTAVVVSAGTSSPSSSTMLGTRAAARFSELAAEQGQRVTVQLVDLGPLARDIADAIVTRFVSPELQKALDLVRDAAALIVTTPVYKAGPSGLFTSFFQTLDNDVLIGTPVLLAATAGSSRHALVIDEQLRSLFSYMRAVSAPTALFAAPEDWGADLNKRIDRAAVELAALVAGGFRERVRGTSWHSYQHSFGSAGSSAAGANSATEINLDSDLMRLAAGGSAS